MVGMSRAQRMGASGKLKSQTHICKIKKSLKCVVTANNHYPATKATLARITFRHPFRKKHIKKLAKASRNHGIVISRNLDYDTSRYTL